MRVSSNAAIREKDRQALRRIFRHRQGARNDEERSVLEVREHRIVSSNAVYGEKDKQGDISKR